MVFKLLFFFVLFFLFYNYFVLDSNLSFFNNLKNKKEIFKNLHNNINSNKELNSSSTRNNLKDIKESIGNSWERIGNVIKNSNDDDFYEEKSDNKKLDQETKEKIEKWLKDNSLNRYGDSGNAIYNGGTPLFNSETGEMYDRYEYIIKNHPGLLEYIK